MCVLSKHRFHCKRVIMAGGNGFDASNEERKGRVHVGRNSSAGLNPFDDNSADVDVEAASRFSDESPVDNDGEEGALATSSTQDADAATQQTTVEATWQYLGEVPYRRVPIYSHVQWKRLPTIGEPTHGNANSSSLFHHGLASFSPYATSKQPHHPKLLDSREFREYLKTSTGTHVKGCPHGGPLAVVTLPVAAAATAIPAAAAAASESGSSSSSRFARAELRILTNAGQPLAQFDLPPLSLEHRYNPSDVLTLGFTSRTTLIVVLRDSLCLTYNLRGEVLLPPFYIMPRTNMTSGTELLQACVYEGGVAVLARDKNCALVELLDQHDDPEYLQTAYLTARKVTPQRLNSSNNNGTTATAVELGAADDSATATVVPHYALITPLPTSEHAGRHFSSFLSIAVLPRSRTTSKHPEVFLSTSDKSVVVVEVSTLKMTDVNCRARMPSAICDMEFCPNGRFLACYLESSMLIVVSTSFETCVLEFDTSQGLKTPPLEMQWCGEDR
jgi:hypothetical protein